MRVVCVLWRVCYAGTSGDSHSFPLTLFVNSPAVPPVANIGCKVYNNMSRLPTIPAQSLLYTQQGQLVLPECANHLCLIWAEVDAWGEQRPLASKLCGTDTVQAAATQVDRSAAVQQPLHTHAAEYAWGEQRPLASKLCRVNRQQHGSATVNTSSMSPFLQGLARVQFLLGSL